MTKQYKNVNVVKSLMHPMRDSEPSYNSNQDIPQDSHIDEASVNIDTEELLHINEVYKVPYKERLSLVGSSLKDDIFESDNKVKTVAFTAASIITQGLDRARLSIILVPHYATEVLENTQSPTKAALVGAGIFWAWNSIVGETLNQGLAELPNTKKEFNHNFPVVVDIFRDSLPGMSDVKEQISHKNATEEPHASNSLNTTEKNKSLRRVGKFISRNLRRGATGVAIGSTAFVATASVDDFPKKEVSKLNLKVSNASGVIVGAVVGGVAYALTELPKRGYPETAQHIQDVATDTRFWYGMAGISIISEFLGNRHRKHKLIQAAESIQENE